MIRKQFAYCKFVFSVFVIIMAVERSLAPKRNQARKHQQSESF